MDIFKSRLSRIAASTLLTIPIFGSFAATANDKTLRKLETLSKVLSFVESNYIEDVKTEEILDQAIRGLVVTLDPHSLYLPPESFREMRVDTKGEFGGLGIEVSFKNDNLVVVAPIEDTPADRAGVKAGDKILKIDGTPTKGMNLLDAVKKLRGQKGSSVTLSLIREGKPEPFDVVLKREKIQIKSVSSQRLEKDYGYVRIKAFQERTHRELARHLEKLRKEAKDPLKGLVLDLRNNPGGILDQAVAVADTFLESGVIVSTIGRKGTFQEVAMAHKEKTEPSMPMIVLVNEGSASASEIVAGALQDHGRAVILGEQTFGKGSVQTIIDLGDGSGLKLTIAKYYTPKGRSIQALGIAPDIIVAEEPPPEPQEEDGKQMREKDLDRHFENSTARPKPEEKPKSVAGMVSIEHDFQLRRAVEYLKTWEVFRSTVATVLPK